MSKSLNNFIPINNMLARYAPESFRMLVFRAHYRSPLNYTEGLLREAEKSIKRLEALLKRLRSVKDARDSKSFSAKIRSEFIKRLDDDFDTPRFLGFLFTVLRHINKAVDKKELSRNEAQRIVKEFGVINKILKIIPVPRQVKESAPQVVGDLIKKRDIARKALDWQKADILRHQIEKLGWIVKDTPNGSMAEKSR